ncbi:MAG: hypothetical protein Q9218_005607 [Villophora microphyllina]
MAGILPSSPVASGSHQLSATILMSDKDHRSLLLTYQDPSQKPVIMLGFVEANATYGQWTWRNETEKLNSAVEGWTSAINPLTACTAGCMNGLSLTNMYLYCFGKSEWVRVDLNLTLPGNLTIGIEYTAMDQYSRSSIDSDIAPLMQGGALFLNQSVPQYGFGFPPKGELPLPTVQFPFEHLASTYAKSSSSTFIYHQLSDTVLAEELWDDTSGFWISNNITIDTA